jgi:hypothetical protein
MRRRNMPGGMMQRRNQIRLFWWGRQLKTKTSVVLEG